MNQQCKVCGEPAAGFHFGAFTCEGCKSFFGRTYNNLGSITECKNNGECVINKKNRTACKACRLRKCLLVGMSKSGSRYGRRSNWFKIHCLLEEQSQNGKLPQGLFGSPGFYPRSLLTSPLGPPPEKLFSFSTNSLHKREDHSLSESGESSADNDEDTKSSINFRQQHSAHTTPSPKNISPFPQSLQLPSSPIDSSYSPPIFFPPRRSPTRVIYPAFKPAATPAFLTTWPPPSLPLGGDLVMCSPALGGVAVEQEHPIDLSVKTMYFNSPPTPQSKDSDQDGNSDDEDMTIDVEMCKDNAVNLKNNPLDLTAKRLELPQSG